VCRLAFGFCGPPCFNTGLFENIAKIYQNPPQSLKSFNPSKRMTTAPPVSSGTKDEGSRK
jgi:hypothetical protein